MQKPTKDHPKNDLAQPARLDLSRPFHCVSCIMSFVARELFISHLKVYHGYKEN